MDENRKAIFVGGQIHVFELEGLFWFYRGPQGAESPGDPRAKLPLVIHPDGTWGGEGHRVVGTDTQAIVVDTIDDAFHRAAEVAAKRFAVADAGS